MADAITVSLPFVGKEIKDGFELIGDSWKFWENPIASFHGMENAMLKYGYLVLHDLYLDLILLNRNDNAFQMKEYTLFKNKLGLFVFVFRFKLAVVTFVEAKQRVMDSLNVFKGIVFLTNQNEYISVITVAVIIKK